MIYLDSAAMERPLPCAQGVYMAAPFGNPSSAHGVGHMARSALEGAREEIASLMGCEPGEVYFTSTATEAAALALSSISDFYVFTSSVEHHAILENVKSGRSGKSTFGGNAVAKMLANNETGEILPHPRKECASYWLCDATAAVGHIPVSFRALGCDYLIADAIKFGGVPGAAFLIAKKGAPLSPLIRGGGQERGMRGGTENVPAICAMAAALEWQMERMEENAQKIGAMRQILFQSLSAVPGHKWNTPMGSPCLPHILNVSFDGVDAAVLTLMLSQDGVMVATGSACSSGNGEPSHVLMAMYGDERRARSAIRISLSHENTPDECVEAAEKIKAAVDLLRRL